jgi:hypothetical protein
MGVIIRNIVSREDNRGAFDRVENRHELAMNCRIFGNYDQDVIRLYRIHAKVTVPIHEEIQVTRIHRQNDRKGGNLSGQFVEVSIEGIAPRMLLARGTDTRPLLVGDDLGTEGRAFPLRLLNLHTMRFDPRRSLHKWTQRAGDDTSHRHGGNPDLPLEGTPPQTRAAMVMIAGRGGGRATVLGQNAVLYGCGGGACVRR